ncbi:hypothetical protein K469DRAFT_493185, partial [Zopfia rhizophila CBS 207.26]
SVRSYAEANNLPYQRLLRAYKGGHNKKTRPKPKPLLTDDQELALEQFLDTINDIGFGIHKDLVAQYCNKILEAAHEGSGKPPQCGKNWSQRWLKAHPKY